jgi:hypothetical protein
MILFGCEQTIYFHDIGCILDHRLINYPSSCTSCFVLIFVSRVKKKYSGCGIIPTKFVQLLESNLDWNLVGSWHREARIATQLKRECQTLEQAASDAKRLSPMSAVPRNHSSKESVGRRDKERRTPAGRIR